MIEGALYSIRGLQNWCHIVQVRLTDLGVICRIMRMVELTCQPYCGPVTYRQNSYIKWVIVKGKNPECQSLQTLRLYRACSLKCQMSFKPPVLHDVNLVLLYVGVVVYVLSLLYGSVVHGQPDVWQAEDPGCTVTVLCTEWWHSPGCRRRGRQTPAVTLSIASWQTYLPPGTHWNY